MQAVASIHAQYAGRITCALGADRFKVELQLDKCGLMPYFKGYIFSGHELPRSKLFPDVYLAAAEALGASAMRCAVIEDSVTGVVAGVAAGATVLGYCPPLAGPDAPAQLRAAGTVAVFSHMSELPELLSSLTSPASPLHP